METYSMEFPQMSLQIMNISLVIYLIQNPLILCSCQYDQ